MSEAFLAEVRLFGFTFAPKDWAVCNGAILPISQNTALFSLIGVNYGGNGTTNFGLPNLAGNVVVGAGRSPVSNTTYSPGEEGGETSVTLTQADLPAHNHTLSVSNFRIIGDKNAPGPTEVLATGSGCKPYLPPGPAPTLVPMDARSLTPAGNAGPQAHNNMMPTIGLNFCICTSGTFPSRP